MRNPACRAALLALIPLILVSCSSLPSAQSEPTVTDRQLLAGDEFPLSAGQVLRTESDAFAISRDMADFLKGNVATAKGERAFGDLLEAMDTFGIRYLTYDNQTLTASEAFEKHRGNCLTFTNMFLVMARQVGLTARFQEVRIPPDWTTRGGMLELRRHMNVRIRLYDKAVERTGERVVDFGDESIPASYIDGANRVISDQRAMAHFYNNWAAESLENGNNGMAFAYLQKALREADPNFSPAWNLVGVMYQRVGREDLAEQAYLRALQAEPGETSALSNLQRLYEWQGRAELSRRYEELVSRHRSRNPYYRLAEAREAYSGGDYGAAIEILMKAIRLKQDESEIYYLLSDAYSGIGDLDEAAFYRARGDELVAEFERMAQSGQDGRGRQLVKPKAIVK